MTFEEWWKENWAKYSDDSCHMSDLHMAKFVWEAARATMDQNSAPDLFGDLGKNEEEVANELRDKAREAGKPLPGLAGGRTFHGGVMDTIAPLIDEIARLRVEVNSLKNQPKE